MDASTTGLWGLFIAPFAEFAFMRRALVATWALALSAAPLGVFLTLRRMSLLGDALSHALLPGVVARLTAERDRVDAALEGLPEAVFGLDGEGRITGANRAALQLISRDRVPRGERLGDVQPALTEAARATEGAHAVTLEPAHYMAGLNSLPKGRTRRK